MKRTITPLFAVVAGLGGPAIADPTTTPRTLPSGAPACGNAQTKSPRPCTETVARPAAVPAPTPVAVAPRTLPSGAPACGNLLDKAGDTKDPMYVSCMKGEWPGFQVRQRLALSRLFGVLGLQAAAYEVREPAAARPRQMRSGAPACGNVASRVSRRDCD